MKMRPPLPLSFAGKLAMLNMAQHKLFKRRNRRDILHSTGLFDAFEFPVITRDHVPLSWRYDMNAKTNPDLIERIGIDAVANPAAIELHGRIYLVCRVDGTNRKSFFAIAESRSPTEGFRFRDLPLAIPESDESDITVGDMRLTAHEDGWIYGLFTIIMKSDLASAGITTKCAVVRTRDMLVWERLPNLPLERASGVSLHPELINGEYALYFHLPDEINKGIGIATTETLVHADIQSTRIIESRQEYTLKALAARVGAPPVKTSQGWLHIAQGVSSTTLGPRHVLYAFLTDLYEPDSVVRSPGGHLIAAAPTTIPSMASCTGVIRRRTGDVFIYYTEAEQHTHVVRTTIPRLLDYINSTPTEPAGLSDALRQRMQLAAGNLSLRSGNPARRRRIFSRRNRFENR